MKGARYLLAAALAGLAASAAAQTGSLPFHDGGGPIAIDADGGIEWRRPERVFVARGNARASQGAVTVRAETMRAHYRDGADGAMEIWRIEAEGGVSIADGQRRAAAREGVYDHDRRLLVLTGRPRLEAAGDTLTAEDRMEYRQRRNLAVASGGAAAELGGRRLRAGEIRAAFAPDGAGVLRLRRVEAAGGVRIAGGGETARAETGVYDLDAGTVRLEGEVRIDRGGDRLAGRSAEIDLNTGVSRIHGGGGGVRGVFAPRQGARGGAR